MASDPQVGEKRFEWFGRMLGLLPVGTLIDLGAGHGLFSKYAADRGWTVTALDARGDRYPVDPRIEWRVGDVRDVSLGDFDVIACLGLFYHLTLADQLSLLKRTSGTALILDTHVSLPGRAGARSVSDIVELDGFKGRLYDEPDQATHSPASWGNDQSFWPTPKSLYRMLDDAGYDVMAGVPWYLPSRTFWLCLPR